MGTFHVDVEIGDPEGRRYDRVEALGVVPHARAWFRLADGHHVEREIGHACIKIGAYALEGLRLAPDPVGRRLVPVPGLLMPLAPA